MFAPFARQRGGFHFCRAHHPKEFTTRGTKVVSLDCSPAPPAWPASRTDGVHVGVPIDLFHCAR